MKDKTFLVTGPVGSGKGTSVRSAALWLRKEVGKAYTTRPPFYGGEQMLYSFVEPDEYETLGEVIEYTDTMGFNYVVKLDELETADIFVADMMAAAKIMGCYCGTVEMIPVMIKAPKNRRLAQLYMRGLDELMIKCLMQCDMDAEQELRIEPARVIVNHGAPHEATKELEHFMAAFEENTGAFGHYRHLKINSFLLREQIELIAEILGLPPGEQTRSFEEELIGKLA